MSLQKPTQNWAGQPSQYLHCSMLQRSGYDFYLGF